MFDDDDSSISLANFVAIFTIEYILKSESSTEIREFKFRKFTNLSCLIHLTNESEIQFCYDTDSTSSLVFEETIKTYYSNIFIYHMKNGIRIRCQEIEDHQENNLYINLLIRIMTLFVNYVIVTNEFHVMRILSFSLVMNTNLMKVYDIFFKWKKDIESNIVFIQKTHEVKVIIIKNESLKARKVFFSEKNFDLVSNFVTSFSLKIKIAESRRKHTNVYFDETIIIVEDKKQNVRVFYKSFIKISHVFESIKKHNFSLDMYFIEMHALISHEIISISMTNFDEISAKIRKNQLFNCLIQSRVSLTSIFIDFDYEKIFIDKTTKIENKIESENLFIIKNSDIDESKRKSDINFHWRLKFCQQVSQILEKHEDLFKLKLD